jgi:alpha-N-arabinofuranosidase
MACMSLLVNAISPIMTATGGPVWRQTTFYPFKYATRHATGVSLHAAVECPGYENPTYGAVPYIDVSAAYDEEKGEITVLAVNRHEAEKIELTLSAGGLGNLQVIEHVVLDSKDPMAANTKEQPLTVVPRSITRGKAERNTAQLVLPAFSWNMLRFRALRPSSTP